MLNLLKKVKTVVDGKWKTEFLALQDSLMSRQGQAIKNLNKEFDLEADTHKIKGKKIICSIDADKIDSVTTGLRFGGVTARFKIVKGVYARFGDLDGARKKTTMVVDTGRLHFYDGGIFYDGDNENHLIRDNDINSVCVTPQENGGLMVEKYKGKPLMFQMKYSPRQFFGLNSLCNQYPK